MAEKKMRLSEQTHTRLLRAVSERQLATGQRVPLEQIVNAGLDLLEAQRV
jgi:hypothetical protein